MATCCASCSLWHDTVWLLYHCSPSSPSLSTDTSWLVTPECTPSKYITMIGHININVVYTNAFNRSQIRAGDKVVLGQVLSRRTSVFPCQYHSTIAPYSFIHLPPTLYNVFLPALQLSPVSIIPPLLHTHSFIYHPHCIMFFSQYFRFPLSVSFHHCSILIHLSTTHAV